MNIGNLAPDPEAFQQQMAQMTELLNSSNASDWPEGAQIPNISNIAFEFDTIAVAEELGVFVDSSPLGASTPHLRSPNELTILQPTTAENIAATLETMGLDKPPEVKSFAGVDINSPMLQQLAQFQPLTKLAILEMGEEKLLQELTVYFESKGMPVPQNPEDAAFKQAIFEIFNERMDNSSAIMPKELTYQLQDSLILLGDSIKYLEFAANIEAPNVSAAENPNVKLGMQVLFSMEEMLKASITELENSGTVAQQEGGVLEYMKNIMAIFREVKMAMFESQMSETSRSHEMMLAKKEAIATRTKKQLKEFKKQEMQMEMQEQMKVFQDTIAILMPSLQILFVIIAIVFLPLAPLVILLSAIVSIMLISIQIALTEEGVMDSAFESINSFAASVMSFVGDDGAAELLFWVTIILVILVIAVVLIMIPGVSAVVPAIAGTLIGWIISNSGIIDTITTFLKDLTGWDDDWADAVFGALAGMSISFLANGVMMIAGLIRQLVEELIKIVFELLIALVELLVTFIVKIVELGINIIAKLITKLIESGVGALTSILKSIINLIIKIIIKLITMLVKLIIKIIDMVVKLMSDLLKTIINIIKSAFKAVLKIVVKALDTLLEMLMNFLRTLIDEMIGLVINIITQIINSIINLIKFIIETVRQITEMILGFIKNNLLKVIQLAGTAQAASFKELQARLSLSMGILEAEISILDAIIKTIDMEIQKAMGQIDSAGVGEFMEVVNDITKFIEKMLSSRSRILSDIVATALA